MNKLVHFLGFHNWKIIHNVEGQMVRRKSEKNIVITYETCECGQERCVIHDTYEGQEIDLLYGKNFFKNAGIDIK